MKRKRESNRARLSVGQCYKSDLACTTTSGPSELKIAKHLLCCFKVVCLSCLSTTGIWPNDDQTKCVLSNCYFHCSSCIPYCTFIDCTERIDCKYTDVLKIGVIEVNIVTIIVIIYLFNPLFSFIFVDQSRNHLCHKM